MIIYPCLINHQVVFVWAFEIQRCIRPFKFWFIGLDYGHIAIAFCRIGHQCRIHLDRFPLIVFVQYFFRIEVRNLFHYAICTHYHVLESIFLTWIQSADFQPKIVAILIHLICIGYSPIIEITNDKHMLCRSSLAGSIGTEGNLGRVILVIINTTDNTCRTSHLYRCSHYAGMFRSFLGITAFCSNKGKLIISYLRESVLQD